jgi:hypothetical protein
MWVPVEVFMLRQWVPVEIFILLPKCQSIMWLALWQQNKNFDWHPLNKHKIKKIDKKFDWHPLTQRKNFDWHPLTQPAIKNSTGTHIKIKRSIKNSTGTHTHIQAIHTHTSNTHAYKQHAHIQTTHAHIHKILYRKKKQTRTQKEQSHLNFFCSLRLLIYVLNIYHVKFYLL